LRRDIAQTLKVDLYLVVRLDAHGRRDAAGEDECAGGDRLAEPR